jgi:hypothetical protein
MRLLTGMLPTEKAIPSQRGPYLVKSVAQNGHRPFRTRFGALIADIDRYSESGWLEFDVFGIGDYGVHLNQVDIDVDRVLIGRSELRLRLEVLRENCAESEQRGGDTGDSRKLPMAWLERTNRNLAQFFIRECDRVTFHAARLRCLGRKVVEISSCDAIGRKTRNFEAIAEIGNP